MLNKQVQKVYEDIIKVGREYSDLKIILGYTLDSIVSYDITRLSKLIFDTYENHLLPNNTQPKQTVKKTFEKMLELYQVNIEKHSIDYWLSAKGMTIKELGEKAGLSKKGIYDIRKGTANPKYTTLVDIAKALGISVTQLKENGGYENRQLEDYF